MLRPQSKWRRRYGGRPGAVEIVTDINADRGEVTYMTTIPGVSRREYSTTTIDNFRGTRTPA